MIRTPDQRLRIFVSSTLRELADERATARRAIEALHLTPVMFESGARPYPPRALYRAYLEQSHVFVGIYWQSYGWVAPGEPVSGLEDEYDLSGARPKLIYVKAPVDARDGRLEALLQRIEADDHASYKSFSSVAELSPLLADDLAVLLSERFENPDETGSSGSSAPKRAKLPSPLTSFIGRQDEVENVTSMFCHGTARLVTLVGPGGIGKTRLAIEAAKQMADCFRDGVVPVFLSGTADPQGLVPAIVTSLGLAENPGMSPLDTLKDYLADRELLLLLDNFEHLVEVAPVVGDLLAECPSIKVLATSREPLRLSGEYQYGVDPLDLPPEHLHPGSSAARASESVRLFIDRARRARPDFVADENSLGAVSEICRRLDGLPLAIELAAARVRLLSVESIAARLDDRLALLVGGARDLPERQRTLRATIDWSYNLLDEPERRLFARLAVFSGGWTLDAAEAVCAEGEGFLDQFSSLLDKSLLRSMTSAEGHPRLSMLETAREYGLEQLARAGEEEMVRRAHADYFLTWARGSHERYRRALGQQPDWVGRVGDEIDNIRAAMRFELNAGRPGYVSALGEVLWDYWWIRSQLREAVDWMEQILPLTALTQSERAAAWFIAGVASVGLSDYQRAGPYVSSAYEAYRAIGDERGEALAGVPLGVALALRGAADEGERVLRAALETFRRRQDAFGISYAIFGVGRVLFIQKRFDEAVALDEEGAGLMRAAGELMLRSVTLLNLAWTLLSIGELADAEKAVGEALDSLAGLHYYEGLARTFEAETGLYLKRENTARAALMFGAAEGVRRSVGARVWAADQQLHDGLESELRSALGDEFESRFAEGLSLSVRAAIELAHPSGSTSARKAETVSAAPKS